MIKINSQLNNTEEVHFCPEVKSMSLQKRKLILFYTIYIILNTVVVFKYGTRQDYINPWILSFLYSFFLIIVLWTSLRLRLREKAYKYLFFCIASLFFLLTIWLNLHVNKFELKVDRWSAMEACIDALINGAYPYSAIDHLQGRSSNLPALIFLGFPFYLLGDVGYLQSFTFILLLILIWVNFKSNKVRLWAILTIVLSSAYCYDVYVKSDIISNFILTLIFVVMSDRRFRKSKKWDVAFNAIGCALLIMTRLVTIIPLILVMAKRYLKFSPKYKLQFATIFLLVIIAACALIFRNVGSYENFMDYNPFYLQNSQLPFLLSLLCVLISFLFSFNIKSTENLIENCTLLLLLPVLLSFISKTIEFDGFYNSILNSRFDISYFNFVIPFLIFYLAILFNKSTSHSPDSLPKSLVKA